MFRQKFLCAAVVCAFLLPNLAFAQPATVGTSGSASAPAKVYTAPKEVIDMIREEGLKRSQVMQHLSYMTDVIGGRLTNSPNMKRANEWTRDTMTKWGMQNAKLEAWGPFGRGWSLREFSVQIVAPQSFAIIGHPKAWSPSTKGTITGEVVHLSIKEEADFEKYRGKLKGAIVLVGNPRELKPDFDGIGRRFTDSQLLEMANAPNPLLTPAQTGGPNAAQIENFIKQRALSVKSLNFLLEEGAAVMADNSSKGSGG